jgi:hypothetical protein
MSEQDSNRKISKGLKEIKDAQDRTDSTPLENPLTPDQMYGIRLTHRQYMKNLEEARKKQADSKEK